MAFDFGAALSSVGQIAPAMSEGAEIRRQRAADAARVSQEAQASQDTHTARLAQVEREKALTQLEQRNANRLTPLSTKPEKGQDGKYYMLFAGPDGRPQRIQVEGDYNPKAESLAFLDSIGVAKDSDLYKSVALGIKPAAENFQKIQQPDGSYVWLERPYTGLPSGQSPGSQGAPATPGVIPTGVKGKMPISSQGTQTDSSRYDPITGTTSTSHTVRRPLGAPGAPSSRGGGGGAPAPSGGGQSSPFTLDDNGMIPPQAVGTSLGKGIVITEPVRAAANQLLSNKIESDQDVESRIRPATRVVAMRYGWQPHQKLSVQERGILQTDQQITGFANEVLPAIEKAGLQKANSASDSARGLQAWAEYKAGRVPSDPFYAQIIKPVAAIAIAGAAPWTRIGRNKYTFDVIQQHLPQPWQTPARIYDNVKWLQDSVVPSSQQSILGKATGKAQDVIKNFTGQQQPAQPSEPENWVRDASGKLVKQ